MNRIASAATLTLEFLNRCSEAEFVDRLGGVFEHAPWVAAVVARRRPHVSVAALHAAMLAELEALPEPALLELLNGHPELAGALARTGAMTSDSQAEQGSLALDEIADDSAAAWDRLNAQYSARFGFPFLLCIRRHTRGSALRAFERRLANERSVELRNALAEIARISRLRLAARIADHGLADIAGRLSTHVLDLSCGRPAHGMRVGLFETGPAGRRLLLEALTGRDGSTDAPLQGGEPLRIGRYELCFHVGDYFRGRGVEAADEPFLDVVPIAFGIAEPEGDYHIPITVTPWAYATYRGS
jgi:2-oxo-4-hydroxy-4-carboxy-5-ureidoimidazoline decarboxylase